MTTSVIVHFKNTLLSLCLQFGLVRRLKFFPLPIITLYYGLLALCYTSVKFFSYFIVQLVLQTFKSLLVLKTVLGTLQSAG